jgi:CBS-domain-containing membrane protein
MTGFRNITECMKRHVFSIPASATIKEAAALCLEKHIGTLPVVDEKGRLVGLLQLRDLLTLVMPDFIKLVQDFGYVGDFGAVENRLPSQEALALSVDSVMQPAIYVEDDCGLLRAFAMLYQEDLLDMPVVNSEKQLVGIASRVDVGTSLLSTWHLSS